MQLLCQSTDFLYGEKFHFYFGVIIYLYLYFCLVVFGIEVYIENLPWISDFEFTMNLETAPLREKLLAVHASNI